MNPPTPSFPVELEKDNAGVYEQLMTKLNEKKTPEYMQSLQAGLFNSMTTTPSIFRFAFRPNNYRRQAIVKLKKNSTMQKIKTAIPSSNINIHTKMISVKDYHGVTIQYAKQTLTAIYSQKIIKGYKQVFYYEAKKKSDIAEAIKKKVDEIAKLMDDALFKFAIDFGIVMYPFKVIWTRHENWTGGDREVRKLPESTVLHHALFKKVYEKGVEFHGGKENQSPEVDITYHIENSVLYEYEPLIATELERLSIAQNPLMFLKSKVTSQLDFLKYPDIVKLLSDPEKIEFWDFLFTMAS